MEIEYDLKQEDYADWIRWNLKKRNKKKTARNMAIGWAVFAIFLMVLTYVQMGVSGFPLAVFFIALVGATMIYGSRDSSQFRFLWRRMGISKMERRNTFPHVKIRFGDIGFTMDIPTYDIFRRYNYADILSVVETNRMILIETEKNMYQMVSKSAFASKEAAKDCIRFLEGKMEEVREHPEHFDERKVRALEDAENDGHTEYKPGTGGKLSSLAHLNLAGQDAEEKMESEDETSGE